MSKSAAQLPGRHRGPGPRRLRRDALVPDVLPDPARRQPGGHRAGHPRRRAPGACCRCGTCGSFFTPVHQRRERRRRLRREAVLRRLRDPLDRTCWPPPGTWSAKHTAQLDGYDISEACRDLRSYLDMLTNWYVRRSRQRFFDERHQRLRRAVHLPGDAPACARRCCRWSARKSGAGSPAGARCTWPTGRTPKPVPGRPTSWSRPWSRPADRSIGSSLRKAANLRVRLPLQELTVVAPGAAALAGFATIVADELNLRTVTLLDAERPPPESSASARSSSSTPAPRARAWARTCSWPSRVPSPATGRCPTPGWSPPAAWTLEPHEYTLETVVAEAGGGRGIDAAAVLPGGGFVVLNTEVTPNWTPRAPPGTWSAPSSRPARTRTAGQRPHPHQSHRHEDVVDALQANAEPRQGTETLTRSELGSVAGRRETAP